MAKWKLHEWTFTPGMANRTSASWFREAVGHSIENVPAMLALHAEFGGALNWLRAVYPGVTDENHQRYYVLVAENMACVEACANVRKVVQEQGILSTRDTWQG